MEKTIIHTKIEVGFNLEISKDKQLTLINLNNNKVYTPNESVFNNKSIITEILNDSSNLKFTVNNIFENDNLEVVFNDIHKVFFLRQLSRKELEEKLDNYGSESKNVNILLKTILSLETTLNSKLSSLEKLIAHNANNIESKTANFKEMAAIYQKEIKLIKELKFEDLNKLLKSIEKDEKREKLAHEKSSELDEKFKHINGEIYFCKGKSNGCTCVGTLWGSNPYTTDDGNLYCLAALHSGMIDENGGYFELKRIGNYPEFPASVQNGISSSRWGSYNGYSIHSTDKSYSKEHSNCQLIERI